jgi:hypothetical protein
MNHVDDRKRVRLSGFWWLSLPPFQPVLANQQSTRCCAMHRGIARRVLNVGIGSTAPYSVPWKYSQQGSGSLPARDMTVNDVLRIAPKRITP